MRFISIRFLGKVFLYLRFVEFPLEQRVRLAAAGRLSRTFTGSEPVEPVEERLEVGQRSAVMHVVLDSAAPEWRPAVRQPRQIVTAVILDADVLKVHHEAPERQRMAADYPRSRRSEDAAADELERMDVLTEPAVDGCVAVMDGVDAAIEPAAAVVKDVPEVILDVEERQREVLVPDELPDAGRRRRKLDNRRPDALRHGNRKDVEKLIPGGQSDAFTHLRPVEVLVRCDLVFTDPGDACANGVHERERDGAREVGDDG